ncbi:MAG: glycosyltransferase [Dehalococcoidales bacterium]|nr:glycosyltransferase [Dehalococcoidales bacterium]
MIDSNNNNGHHDYRNSLVSICVPTYNAEETILATLDSIFRQTYDNLEIIVLDNASTDNTFHLLESIHDPRLTIHQNPSNIGAENSFEKLVRMAKGEYVAIFHSDDVYNDNIVEKEVKALHENPSAGAVFTLCKNINDRGGVIRHVPLPSQLRGKQQYHFLEIVPLMMEKGNFLVTPSCMVKRDLYGSLLPFDTSRFGVNADFDMWLRLIRQTPIIIIEEELLSYRISNKTGSYAYRFTQTQEMGFFKVIDYHLSQNIDGLCISDKTRCLYEFSRKIDQILRAINYLYKGQPNEAKSLLKKTVQNTPFTRFYWYLTKPKYFIFWLFGIVLLGLTYLSLGHYKGTGLHWLIYRRNSKV